MKRFNEQSGKVGTIFLAIFSILLMSLTAISIFFFQKELEKRKMVETILEKAQNNEQELDKDLKDIKKQLFVLEEKNKEADERINSLLDELELEEGLREELKKENLAIKADLNKETKETEKLRDQLARDLGDSELKLNDLQTQLKKESNYNKELEIKIVNLEQQLMGNARPSKEKIAKANKRVDKEIELEKIEVIPNKVPQGRILSVDVDTEFVIVNLGEKDGLKIGKMLSVYRGKDYLGDIRITRLQPEMSAADLIPPFSSRTVRKNDQVIAKE